MNYKYLDSKRSAIIDEVKTGTKGPVTEEEKWLLKTTYFEVPETMDTVIKAYNIMGQLVRSYPASEVKNGKFYFTFDGKDNKGNNLASGVYIVRMEGNGFTQTKKVTYVR
jgi:flagellar hook assembly protein FlgD